MYSFNPIEYLRNAYLILINSVHYLLYQLQIYGWHIVFGSIIFYYVFKFVKSWISPLVEYVFKIYINYRKRKEEREYDAKYHKDPDLHALRISAQQEHVQKLQEKYNLQIREHEAKLKEKKEKKKQEVLNALTKGGYRLGGDKDENKPKTFRPEIRTGNFERSDDNEDVPAIFPKMFIAHDKNATGILYFTKERIISLNKEFVKGYSLKAPKSKTFEKKYPKLNHRLEEEIRTKRGIVHLYNMVSCATGCSPLKYKGYGCYCGFLGSGYPVDGIDKCCKKHDWCYHYANCPMYLEYFVPYFWKCWYSRPLCAIDHGEFGGPGSCADKLCKCDRALSECLKRYPCPSKRAFCKSSPLRFFQNVFMLFA